MYIIVTINGVDFAVTYSARNQFGLELLSPRAKAHNMLRVMDAQAFMTKLLAPEVFLRSQDIAGTLERVTVFLSETERETYTLSRELVTA